jgi:hypothetical protein
MIEIIELARVERFSRLDRTIVHDQTGIPGEGVPDCDPEVFIESGASDLILPSGGLFGSASISTWAKERCSPITPMRWLTSAT